MRRLIVYACFFVGINASAQDELIGEYASFWDIPLGVHALELNPILFAEYACGTNGGPPSRLISGWADYAECNAEEGTGLHEVQFRYDDEPEYWARAYDLRHLMATFNGTQISTVAVILSALFDSDGFLVGLRAVTDPRVEEQERLRSIALGAFMQARFGGQSWICVDLPEIEGETPIGTRYQKDRCTQSTETLDLVLESNYFRKPGQYGLNPVNNAPSEGLFESSIRFEMFLNQPIADAEERIADIIANPRELSDAEINREMALDCPGCDLAGLDLKRQDLTGANLAGADLSGANLHGAILIGANLAGAILTEANLNRSNLRQADLTGAMMRESLLYGAIMDGVNLTGADLTSSKAQEARMTSATLTDARMVAVNLSRARLPSVTALNTNFGGSWFFDAQLTRGNFTGATFLQAILQNVTLTNANLTDADFNTADLILADMRGADLTRTDFTNARLTQARMADTNREDAFLEDAFDAPP